jgi:hypothetical protein
MVSRTAGLTGAMRVMVDVEFTAWMQLLGIAMPISVESLNPAASGESAIRTG